MRIWPSRPYHLLKVSPLNTVTMALRFHHEFGRGQSFKLHTTWSVWLLSKHGAVWLPRWGHKWWYSLCLAGMESACLEFKPCWKEVRDEIASHKNELEVDLPILDEPSRMTPCGAEINCPHQTLPKLQVCDLNRFLFIFKPLVREVVCHIAIDNHSEWWSSYRHSESRIHIYSL
jgi:hypothetical protein